MSNLVKQVEIERIIRNGRWHEIAIKYVKPDGQRDRIEMNAEDYTFNYCSEVNATILVVNWFLFGLDTNWTFKRNLITLESNILRGFRQLRENDLSGNSQQTMEIFVERDLHYLCKTNKNPNSNGNEISQSELQQTIATFAKDNKVMKFFQDNKCSVCLCSYKEVLDENRHIVIPSCGHPLCCGCADNILMSEKKECPRCRGNITADSFKPMKFNVDHEMNTEDQRVFL